MLPSVERTEFRQIEFTRFSVV